MPQRVISFHYKLTDKAGANIDSSEGRPAFSFLEGAGQIVPGLEKELVSLKKGDKKRVEVAAKDAYGQKDPSLVLTIPREQLPVKEIKVGDLFRGGQEEHSPVFKVVDLTLTNATLDGNHPLAGQDLVFEVELTDAREATAEELTHGHAHGPEGHHHH